MGRAFTSAVAMTMLAVALFLACSSSAVGVDACRQLEDARCANAPRCKINLSDPPHRGGPVTDVASCQRFYSIECLHGLTTTVSPSTTEVQACLSAINNGSCDIVMNPQIADASCGWLNAVAPATVDAGVDVDAADAADVAVDTSPDTSL
jgi:hypothetical protein